MNKKLKQKLMLFNKYLTAWQVAKAFKEKKDAWLVNPQERYVMVKYSMLLNIAYVVELNDIMKCTRESKNMTQMFVTLNKVLKKTTLAEYQTLTGKDNKIIELEKMMCLSSF